MSRACSGEHLGRPRVDAGSPTRTCANEETRVPEQPQHGFGDDLRHFGGQVVADPRNIAPVDQLEKFLPLGVRHDARDAVRLAVQDDRRHRDRRLRGERLLDRLERRVSRRIAVAVPVRVDRHVDEIGIVPGGRGPRERLLIERPMRRPQAPQQPAEIPPVGGEPGAAALEVEVVLVPLPQLLLGRRGRAGVGNVLDVVAVAGDEGAHALRPQRRDDAGGASAPVVSDQHRLADPQRIHQLPEVVAERGLLARPQGLGRQEAGRPEPAQIRHDRAAPGLDQPSHHRVVDARAVRPAVHEEHAGAGRRSAVLVMDVQRGRPGSYGQRRHGRAPGAAAARGGRQLPASPRRMQHAGQPGYKLVRMTLAEFQRSLTAKTPPRGLAPPLAALWWAKQGRLGQGAQDRHGRGRPRGRLGARLAAPRRGRCRQRRVLVRPSEAGRPRRARMTRNGRRSSPRCSARRLEIGG